MEPDASDAKSGDDRALREAFGFDLDDESWVQWLRASWADLPLGRLGPYELLAELGRGGQGVVYKARQPKTQRIIAVKHTTAAAVSSTSFRVRFEREVRTAAALQHPNIVTVFGGDVVDGRPLLLMEYVDGVPIDRWVAGDDHTPRADTRRIVGVFERLCAAVAHAHQRGVIHRDLKPSNVLVDSLGEPHILDFGLARLLSPFASESLFATHTTAFVGTPLYASPEHFADDESAVDVRSDVYAVGVMLYQALTGQLPYSGKLSFSALMKAIQSRDPPRPTALAPQLGRELEAIVLKALAKDKRERYQSMDALTEDLRRYLAGETVLAHPPSMVYQLRKLVRRHKLAFGSVAGFIVLIAAFAVVAAMLAMRERAARLDADWNSYVASIAAASAALRADDAAAAQAHLSRAPAHLRNWEWHYFSRQADGSVSSALALGPTVAVDKVGEPILSLTSDNRIERHRSPEQSPAAVLRRQRIGVYMLSSRLRYALCVAQSDPANESCKQLVLLSNGQDRTIATWCRPDDVGAMFSPDETTLVTVSWQGVLRVLHIPDLASAPQAQILADADFERFDLFPARIEALAFRPSSPQIAACADGGEIKILDLNAKEVVQNLHIEGRSAYALAFSPDGALLAAGTLDKHVMLWDLNEENPLWNSTGHREVISSLAFSPDGTLLASASWDKSINVWDTSSGRLLDHLVGHAAEVESVAFLENADLLMSCDRNGTLKSWQLSKRRPTIASGAFRRIESLHCSPGAAHTDWLAVGEGLDDAWKRPRVGLIDLQRRRKVADVVTETALMSEIGASRWSQLPIESTANGQWLAVGMADGSVLLWRGADLAAFLSHPDESAAVPDPAKRLPLTDVAPDTAMTELRLQSPADARLYMPTGLSFGPDNRSLVVTRFDGSVQLWDVERAELYWTRPEPAGARRAICTICPDGKRLAFVDDTGLLQLLRQTDAQVLEEMRVSLNGQLGVRSLAFSPDGSLLVPLVHGNDIVLHRTQNLSPTRQLRGHSRQVNDVAFSPDGTRLVSAGDDGLKLWDVASGREVAMLYGHDFNVTCVVFTLDGRTIISGGHDNTVRFWDAGGE